MQQAITACLSKCYIPLDALWLGWVGLANEYYGFPRLYRRFAEFNKRVTSNRQTIRRRQDAMKFVFRIPNRIAAFFRGIILTKEENPLAKYM
ncbi:hypothetical protein P5673_009234 [Acropora cervicornis]|uniref:Uncharacterized protein n=1 Tax=Acropora cervicornis TaxID=6130 RepID=A0AAD9VAB0_ACRCE|nr:hypothetical protein P5673_009234 [Acropora cervicornis]